MKKNKEYRAAARRQSKKRGAGRGLDGQLLTPRRPSSGSTSRLGIDIGRVIINPAAAHGKADTSFLSGGEDRAMQTPPAKDAFRIIHQLSRHYGGRVWLVSKCGPRIEGRTRRWLAHQRFFETTEIAPSHLRFCRQRRDKRQHCEALGITHFVDDRFDVLRHLRGLVPHLYLFGHQQRGQPQVDWLLPVADWQDVAAELLP